MRGLNLKSLRSRSAAAVGVSESSGDDPAILLLHARRLEMLRAGLAVELAGLRLALLRRLLLAAGISVRETARIAIAARTVALELVARATAAAAARAAIAAAAASVAVAASVGAVATGASTAHSVMSEAARVAVAAHAGLLERVARAAAAAATTTAAEGAAPRAAERAAAAVTAAAAVRATERRISQPQRLAQSEGGGHGE